MNSLARQISSSSSAISANSAVPLSAAVERTGLSLRHLRRLAFRLAGQKPPLAWRRGKQWWIAASALTPDPRSPTPDPRPLPPDFGLLPEHRQKRAQQKLAWIRQWERAVADPTNRGRCAVELARLLVTDVRRSDPQAKISVSSMYQWRRTHDERGITGLIDEHASAAGHPEAPDKIMPAGRSPQAVSFFNDLYLTQQKRSIALCHEMARLESAKHHWSWPGSYSSARAYVNSLRRDVVDLHRRGWTYYYRHHLEFAELDYSGVLPADCYVADSHDLKAFCRFPDRSVGRPVLVANLDLATRLCVGWAFCRQNNEQTNLAVLRRSFCDWAVAKKQKCDNGKDYDARTIQGITKQQRFSRRQIARETARYSADDPAWGGVLPELGVVISHAKPFNPRAKIIERFFGTVTNRFAVNLPTFCDTDPQQKPEALKQIIADYSDEVPTLQDVTDRFATWLDADYHVRDHEGDGMLGTPLATWNAKAASLRKADPDALAILCQVRGAFKVGANGVGITIGGKLYRYGRDCPQLRRYRGREVLVAADETDMRQVYCFTPDRDRRRLICVAPANERISANEPVDSELLREANRCVERAKSAAKRANATAADRMIGASQIAKRMLAERSRAVQQQKKAAGAEGATIIPLRTGFEAASAAAHDQAARNPINNIPEISLEDISSPAEDTPATDDGMDAAEILEMISAAP